MLEYMQLETGQVAKLCVTVGVLADVGHLSWFVDGLHVV